MSDFINKIYDDMELQDVVCRLPADLAVSAIKRRITDIEQLFELFITPDGGSANKCKDMKVYANSIISNTGVDKLFETFETKHHPVLFKWLNDTNSTRLLNEGKQHLTIEFLYNLSAKDDLAGMTYVLDRTLAEPEPSVSKITTVLNSVESNIFQALLNKIIKDTRPEVRSSVLSIHNPHNGGGVSEHQKMVGLKALAKLPSSVKGSGHIMPLNFTLFQNLRPLERIMALDRYLNYFPLYKKIKCFDPKPTEQEFKDILFAGAFQYNDLTEEITKRYKAITEDDDPDKDKK